MQRQERSLIFMQSFLTLLRLEGSSNGCYTKNVTVNHTDKIFFANVVTKNGALWLTNWEFDGYPAASPNSSEFGEATLTEQVYGVGPDGESGQPTANDAYGPVTPATKSLLVEMKFYQQRYI
tara:strand:+ start:210 stop:575 length:366 start_codon:yes stop_codon:yes gene_type:complete